MNHVAAYSYCGAYSTHKISLTRSYCRGVKYHTHIDFLHIFQVGYSEKLQLQE
jgi:hypothetical protein